MIAEAQRRLAELGYWIAGTGGKWSEPSRQAWWPSKGGGRPRTGKLTVAELQALRGAVRPSPREKGFAHIEVDLKRQVLFVVDSDGTVSKILPVSSGNGKMFELEGDTLPPSRRPGASRLCKTAGLAQESARITVLSKLHIGGIAIHGNPAVLLSRPATAAFGSQCLPPKSSAS